MKALIGSIMAIFLLTGCGGMLLKRGIEDNTFYSTSNPKLFIRFSDDFEFLEENDAGQWVTSVGGMGGRMTGTESYAFLSEEKRAFAGIELLKIGNRAYWKAGQLRGVAPKLDYGETVIKGFNYEYVVTSSNIEDKDSYLIQKIFARVSGGDREILTSIVYKEVVKSASGFNYSYSDWNDPDNLSAEQVNFLREFNKRAKSSITFLDHYEVTKE